jgi:hypothetical protein
MVDNPSMGNWPSLLKNTVDFTFTICSGKFGHKSNTLWLKYSHLVMEKQNE